MARNNVLGQYDPRFLAIEPGAVALQISFTVLEAVFRVKKGLWLLRGVA
jgi:hypothetical protein